MEHRTLAMFVLIVASFLDMLDATILNVALPAIRVDIGASPSRLEWIVGGYAVAFAAVLITGGRLGDIVGRRRVFSIGVAGFTLASALAACAGHGGIDLVAARVVQGSFAALMVTQVLASAQALYAPEERTGVLGAIGAASGLATVVGPLLGGWLITADPFGGGWRSIFAINVPIGIALLLAAVRWVPDTRAANPPRLDLSGFMLVTATLVLLCYPLFEGRSLGWPGWIWAIFAAVPVLGVLFVAEQRREAARGEAPLVPMHLLTDRGFTTGGLTIMCSMGSMAGFFLILALYLQGGLGFSPLGAGSALLPFSFGALAGSGISARLAAKAAKPMVVLGAGTTAAGLWWLRHTVDVQGGGLSGWDLLWPLAIGGLGLGLSVVPLTDLAVATVDVRNAGAASGVFATCQEVAGALGIAVIATVFFEKVGDDAAFDALREALLTAVWISIGGFCLAAVAGLGLPPSTTIARPEAPADDVGPPSS